MAKKRVGVLFEVDTPAGKGYAVMDKRDANRLLEERNPEYGRKINAPFLVPRKGAIPWEDAKRYVGSAYATKEQAKNSPSASSFDVIEER